MEISFAEIKRNHLPNIGDDRTLMKWMDKEGIYYIKEKKCCFKVEFLNAFEAIQIRDIKKQNPIDHANRIEKLKEMEATMLGTISAPIPATMTLPPKIKVELNPAFKKPEKLEHLKLGTKEPVTGLHVYCTHKDCN